MLLQKLPLSYTLVSRAEGKEGVFFGKLLPSCTSERWGIWLLSRNRHSFSGWVGLLPPTPVQAVLGPLWDGSWTALMVLSMSPKERNTCCDVVCHPRSCCSSGAWVLPSPPHPTLQGTAAFMPLWILLSQRAVITTMWTHGHVNQRAP